MSHDNSPAEILRQALVAAAVGALPDTGTNAQWPLFVGHLPETPDNAACIYDTTGRRDGRIMQTGENIDKPGVQIRVRAVDHPAAYQKILEMARYIETIAQLAVSIGGDSYTIHSVMKSGTVLSLGHEGNARRRVEFTVNLTITYTNN